MKEWEPQQTSKIHKSYNQINRMYDMFPCISNKLEQEQQMAQSALGNIVRNRAVSVFTTYNKKPQWALSLFPWAGKF